MINTCSSCGEYQVDKAIDPAGPFAICPVCQHRHPFRQLPLLLICGASGVGKTAVCERIVKTIPGAVLLDADILWRPEFNKPDDGYRDFFETWLRLGKNVGQSGRPLALFGAGFIPQNVEPCIERRYFAETHYLALTCSDDILSTRLQGRPQWRSSGDEQFILEQIKFNHWLGEQAHLTDSRIELLDTSQESIRVTAARVTAWIQEQLAVTNHSLGGLRFR